MNIPIPEALEPFWHSNSAHVNLDWHGVLIESYQHHLKYMWVLPGFELTSALLGPFHEAVSSDEESAINLSTFVSKALERSGWGQRRDLLLPGLMRANSVMEAKGIGPGGEGKVYVCCLNVRSVASEEVWLALGKWVDKGLRESFANLAPFEPITTALDTDPQWEEVVRQKIAKECSWRESAQLDASISSPPAGQIAVLKEGLRL